MRHNEDVVSAWGGGVCDVPHRIGENVPGAIYVETPLCDVPHRIGENVPSAIYVETPLNQVDSF